jgi:hypothetical protein
MDAAMDAIGRDDSEELEEVFKQFDHPADAWDSRIVRRKLAAENAAWIGSLRPWSRFVTLTFRNETPTDVAMSKFRKLVTSLNREVFGKHYARIVGHSYFSYVLGIEQQKRDVIHFHMLADRPLHFERIHKLWNEWAGFAWTEIVESREKVVEYVCKYVTKGGEVLPYLAKKAFVPPVVRDWWIERP